MGLWKHYEYHKCRSLRLHKMKEKVGWREGGKMERGMSGTGHSSVSVWVNGSLDQSQRLPFLAGSLENVAAGQQPS